MSPCLLHRPITSWTLGISYSCSGSDCRLGATAAAPAIPALESAHAVAYAAKEAKRLGKGKTIIVNLSGRGDKDVDHVRRIEAGSHE